MTSPAEEFEQTFAMGEVADGDFSMATTIDCRVSQAPCGQGKRYLLSHISPGYERTGDTASWTEERWDVSVLIAGTFYGARFDAEAEARRIFDRWTLAEGRSEERRVGKECRL